MADIAVASKQMEQNIHKIFCKARSLSPLFVYSLWLLGLHTWLVEAVRAPKVQLILFHFHVMPSLKRSKIRMWYTDLLEDVLLIPFSFTESLHLTQRHSKDGGRAPVSKPTNLVFHRFGIAINAFKTSIITSWCFQPISNICCQIGSSPPNKSGWKKTTTTSKNPPTKQTINSKRASNLSGPGCAFLESPVASVFVGWGLVSRCPSRFHPSQTAGWASWLGRKARGKLRSRRGKEPWPSKQQTVGWHGDLMLIYVYIYI